MPWKTLVVLLAVVVAGFALFRWVTSATPVTKRQALQIFHHEKRSARARVASPTDTEARVPDHAPPHRSGVAGKSKHVVTTARPPVGRTGSPRTSRPSAPAMTFAIPREGTYSYRTHGQEQMSGESFRHFPKTTYRNIVYRGPNAWTEHHIFLKERQQWSDVHLTTAGEFADRTRQHVEFGITEDETITFDPPMRYLTFPLQVGRTWSGTFQGDTYGDYTATLEGHRTMDVAGTPTDVWLDDLTLHMHGHIDGTAEVKDWVAPAYGLVVDERFAADASKGPLTYTATWHLHLLSLSPDR